MTKEIEEMTFEDALQELERTVQELESGDLSLQESLDLFERGQKLAKQCSHHLQAASLRVEQLTEDGEISELELA